MMKRFVLKYLPRWMNRAYADHFGYNWEKCRFCGKFFGYHESNVGDIKMYVEYPLRKEFFYSVRVCPRCAKHRVEEIRKNNDCATRIVMRREASEVEERIKEMEKMEKKEKGINSPTPNNPTSPYCSPSCSDPKNAFGSPLYVEVPTPSPAPTAGPVSPDEELSYSESPSPSNEYVSESESPSPEYECQLFNPFNSL